MLTNTHMLAQILVMTDRFVNKNSVMDRAGEELHHITCVQAGLRTEFYGASEPFLWHTGAQIAPAVPDDHCQIGDGQVGPVGAALKTICTAVVRRRYPAYQALWNTPVSVGKKARDVA